MKRGASQYKARSDASAGVRWWVVHQIDLQLARIYDAGVELNFVFYRLRTGTWDSLTIS
jgi:hypothetical protein